MCKDTREIRTRRQSIGKFHQDQHKLCPKIIEYIISTASHRQLQKRISTDGSVLEIDGCGSRNKVETPLIDLETVENYFLNRIEATSVPEKVRNKGIFENTIFFNSFKIFQGYLNFVYTSTCSRLINFLHTASISSHKL